MIKTKSSYLTTKQAAEFLSVSPKTLANWRSEGTGPNYTRFLNQCRYSIKDLKDFKKKKSEKILTSYFMTFASKPLSSLLTNLKGQ